MRDFCGKMGRSKGGSERGWLNAGRRGSQSGFSSDVQPLSQHSNATLTLVPALALSIHKPVKLVTMATSLDYSVPLRGTECTIRHHATQREQDATGNVGKCRMCPWNVHHKLKHDSESRLNLLVETSAIDISCPSCRRAIGTTLP
jgi:hypothetical protein